MTPRLPPPCSRMGVHCDSLSVVLRVSHVEGGLETTDDEATWLLGHTDRITFGDLWRDEEDLYVDATLHVPCKYLHSSARGVSCRAHGHSAPTIRHRPRPVQGRRLGGERFRIAEQGRLKARRLPMPPEPSRKRGLPVIEENPCATAACRTSDNRQGAACCRDLQVEIMCTRSEARLEALLRARKSPYVCKVTRTGDFTVDAEVLSACGYLGDDSVSCSLHGRKRPDGRPAKPKLCFTWPPKREVLHFGCVLGPRNRRRTRRP